MILRCSLSPKLIFVFTVAALFFTGCHPAQTVRPGTSSSLGKPNDGRLRNGRQLTARPGMRLNNPERSWGTEETISLLNYAVDAMLDQFPDTCDLFIGDISKRSGGHLSPHISHQSGRDVDVSMYARGNRFIRFILMNETNLDKAKTWYLLETLLETDRVRLVLLDYQLQKLLYNYLKPIYPKWRLDKYFQYPRPKSVRKGIIRHATGHANHLHIRFRCPTADNACEEW